MIAPAAIARLINEKPPVDCRVLSPKTTCRGLEEKASSGSLKDIATIQNNGNAATRSQSARPALEISLRAKGCSNGRERNMA
jgi:hypothetical protein